MIMNVGRLLSDTARRYGERTGLVWRDRSWTWREIDARVNALASAFRQLGVRKGDRIMTFCQNSSYLFEVMWACFKCGAILVPANCRLSPPEAAYIANFSGAKLLIYDGAFQEHRDAACAHSGSIVRAILAHGAQPGPAELDALIEAHAGAPAREEAVEYADGLWFFFTSGTTGRPKAAVLTHGQMTYVLTNYLADVLPGLGCGDASLVIGPLSHGAGIHMLPVVARGAPTVLLPEGRLDVEAALRLIEAHRITNFFAVPTMIKMLVESPAIDRYDHSSLSHVVYAGAPMYREDQVVALKKLGQVLVQYYGLGEVTSCITHLPRHLHSEHDGQMRVGSCGIARTGMQIEIQDSAGRALSDGATGEICVKGPAVFAGYYNDEAATRACLRGGWFHTGDLGHLDSEGFLYITGRASDMYISGGSNIYPREIEEKLLEHPAVALVAVVGVPDPRWGEVGAAVVVPRAGCSPSETELIEFLRPRLARYKCPKHFFFWDTLPVSAYGKILKQNIREELQRRQASSALPDVEKYR